MVSWVFFNREDPEYRNFAAFDLVIAELNVLTRTKGAARALIERTVLVERAIANGIPHHDVELAITYLVMAKLITERDGVLRMPSGVRGLPSEQLRAGPNQTFRNPSRERADPIVKDVIERRTDGRPKHAEPLDAFADELEKLGYGRFRLWWKHPVAELRHTDPNGTPVSASVLAAALVAGALTFIVAHAHKSGVSNRRTTTRTRGPGRSTTWSRAPPQGAPQRSSICKPRARNSHPLAAARIHPGRMLSDYPDGPPDIRPEEARDAKGTAEQVVRAVLDWLNGTGRPHDVHPPHGRGL